jgi:hypothetical protein
MEKTMRKILTVLLLTIAACSRAGVQPDPADDSDSKSGSVAAPTQDSDWKAIEAIEAQAKTIAKANGCSTADVCRAAPVGSRACGGPRYYIPYCSVTTDSAALFNKLQEVASAEQAYNKKYNLASTCEMRLPPALESSGGSCVAK